MQSTSRLVNQQMLQCQLLLDAFAKAEGAAAKALLHSAYLQLELGIGFYWMELLEGDRDIRSKAGVVPPRLLSFNPDTAPYNTINSAEYLELCRLWAQRESWLGRYLSQLTVICTSMPPSRRNQELKAEIFDTVGDDSIEQLDDQIKLTSIAEPELSPESLNETIKDFKEMIVRHRSTNEEY